MAVDLGKLALAGLLHRNPELDPKAIDYLMYGTVIQESRTSNIAREVCLVIILTMLSER
jgi:acetyl-CoA acyltransferase